MHPAISTNYIIPGLLLNPVLFLWSINTILSRVLPPIIVDAAVQPPSYYPLGPSAEHPHIDIHASESVCWSYTAFIVCANLAAFGRVSGHRAAGKEQARLKKELARKMKREARLMNIEIRNFTGSVIHVNGAINHEDGAVKSSKVEHAQECSEQSDQDSSTPEWSDFFDDS